MAVTVMIVIVIVIVVVVVVVRIAVIVVTITFVAVIMAVGVRGMRVSGAFDEGEIGDVAESNWGFCIWFRFWGKGKIMVEFELELSELRGG